MGCGQSKILIYNRKSKSDNNDKHNTHSSDDCYTEASQLQQNSHSPDQIDLQLPNQDCDSNLFENSEISTSQIDFFRMLDEKIENGPDYAEDEQEREQERQRLLRLLNEWLRRPQLDTQRFPTAYHACPPPPRFCPQKPQYSQPRPYLLPRAITVQTADMHYMDHRRDDMYADHYIVPQEPAYGYSRSMLQTAVSYTSPMDSQDMYMRGRLPSGSPNDRTVCHGRHPLSEVDNMAVSNEYLQRSLPVQYAVHSTSHALYGDPSHYMMRLPPREMPPLQGVPGPPHGSPRPLAVRLPTGVTWRRPRGPVTELA